MTLVVGVVGLLVKPLGPTLGHEFHFFQSYAEWNQTFLGSSYWQASEVRYVIVIIIMEKIWNYTVSFESLIMKLAI